jgi:broad specificity phosphatase PhoE
MFNTLHVKQAAKPDLLSENSTKEGMSEFRDIPMIDKSMIDDSRVIYAMRHGRTALDVTHRCDSWVDLDLSPEGEQGVVVTLSEYLQAIPIKTIVTSDFVRAQTTARIVKSGMPTDPEVVINNDLKTWNLGTVGGSKKTPERKKFVKHLIEHPEVHAPDGDSYNEFTGKFDPVMQQQMDDLDSGEIEGPILDILSGSNFRRLGELIKGNRNALDVKEAGLVMLYPVKGKWDGVVIASLDEDDSEIS